MLKYLKYTTACDIAFGVFLVIWLLTRHIAFPIVCWSIIADVPSVMPYGCYDSVSGARVSTTGGSAVLANVLQPFNDPKGLVCFNGNIRWGFLSLLCALQVLTLIWFGMILRVAWGVISGKGVEDSRSDNEESDELEDELEELEDSADDLALLEHGEIPVKAESHADDAADESKQGARRGSPTASSSSGGRGRRTRGAARTSAISIPGHGDRKELLGRIGCDKPT